MKRYPANPTRFVDLTSEQIPAAVGLLIRSAIEAPGEQTPRVKWRIRYTLQQRVEKRSRWLRLALVGMCMFVMGGVVGASVQPLMRARRLESSAHTEAPPASPASHGARRRGQVQEPAAVALPVASAEVEGAMVAAAPPPLSTGAATARTVPPWSLGDSLSTQTARSRPSSEGTPPAPRFAVPAPVMPVPRAMLESSAPTPVTPPPTVAPPPTPASTREQALIATALDKLRSGHEPEAALAALEEHRSRFPTGVLAPEAARLRTEALLLLGRKAAVLDELDSAVPSATTPGEDRLLLRGELRAGAGRWRAALADFDAVVRAHSAASADLDDRRSRKRLERALWGRASARSHLGDESGARDDLQEYVRRFPDGRFAIRASRLLEDHRRP